MEHKNRAVANRPLAHYSSASQAGGIRDKFKNRLRELQHSSSQIYQASLSQKFLPKHKRPHCEETTTPFPLPHSPKVFAEFFEKRREQGREGRVGLGSGREGSMRECLQRKIIQNVRLHRREGERLPKLKRAQREEVRMREEHFAVWSVQEKEELMGHSIPPPPPRKRLLTDHPLPEPPRKTFFRDFTPWCDPLGEEV